MKLVLFRLAERLTRTTRTTNPNDLHIYAFGELVPAYIIEELLGDGMSPEEITTEFMETYLYYDYMDNQ